MATQYTLPEPSSTNLIRECPHCGERKVVGLMTARLWGGLNDLDNTAQYYLFHENLDALKEYWNGLERKENSPIET